MAKHVAQPNSSIVPIDAAGKPVGRVASMVARTLLGKDRPAYAPNRVADVRVIVTGVDRMVFTGKKIAQKRWYRHSGYHGGITEIPAARLMERDPRLVLRRAVRGMLPDNRLRQPRLMRLEFRREAQ